MTKALKVFTGNANPSLARAICDRLGIELGRAEVSNFSDGEINVEILENIRGRDTFIVQPTCPPTSENLMELLIMVDAAKRASAARITAVIPYFGFARQDRRHHRVDGRQVGVVPGRDGQHHPQRLATHPAREPRPRRRPHVGQGLGRDREHGARALLDAAHLALYQRLATAEVTT